MEQKTGIAEYSVATLTEGVSEVIDKAMQRAAKNNNIEVWKRCFACLDLSMLDADDNSEKIAIFAGKAVEFHSHFRAIPNVAAICVYPIFVDTVGLVTGSSGLSIASVAGGFPSAQTYLEVKMLEVAMVVENGADEVDVVMNPGQFLAGDYHALEGEIRLLKEEAGEDVVLKVIIESGLLKFADKISEASLLAMIAGADFIKTSTGKTEVSATPESTVVMCRAIKAFYEKTGRKVGFKAAGGIRSVSDAVLYYSIVETVLGDQWLNPGLFRLGASSLANRLLSAIEGREIKYF